METYISEVPIVRLLSTTPMMSTKYQSLEQILVIGTSFVLQIMGA